jgi:hypothetical protein
MTIDVEQMQRDMKERFNRAGLLPFLVDDSSEINDLGGELYVDVVMSDRSKIGEADELVRSLLKGKTYSLVVRSKWIIEGVGDIVPAYGQNGGLKAAVLIPVTLRSGAERTSVTVAVTKMAEWEFEGILGRKADLKQVATIVVESALRRSGNSFWDPIEENYLEVASGAAANISRLLKHSA